MSDDITCDYCESAVEDLGLCLAHLNEELDFELEYAMANTEDMWPDFHDEGSSWYWDAESQVDRYGPVAE